jgi:hypothetical protein
MDIYEENSPKISIYEQVRDTSIPIRVSPSYLFECFGFYTAYKNGLNILKFDDLKSSYLQKIIDFSPTYNEKEIKLGEIKETLLNTTSIIKYNMYDISHYNNITEVMIGGSILAGKSHKVEKLASINLCSAYIVNTDSPSEKNFISKGQTNCNITSLFNGELIFGYGYDTELLNPYLQSGFQKFNIQDNTTYNPSTHYLSLKIMITVNEIQTDHSMLYSFGRQSLMNFYEKDVLISLVEKKANYFTYIKINYELNSKKKTIKRSYTKVDDVLASSFSIINILLITLQIIHNFLIKNIIEYEIINRLYYEKRFALKEYHKDNMENKNLTFNNKVDYNINQDFDKVINTNNIKELYKNRKINELDYRSNSFSTLDDLRKSSNRTKSLSNNNIIKINNTTVTKKINLINASENVFINKDYDCKYNLSKTKFNFETIFFNYEAGFMDAISTYFLCVCSKSTKSNQLKKEALLKIASTDLDVLNIISKLIQNEKILDCLKYNKYFQLENTRDTNSLEKRNVYGFTSCFVKNF